MTPVFLLRSLHSKQWVSTVVFVERPFLTNKFGSYRFKLVEETSYGFPYNCQNRMLDCLVPIFVVLCVREYGWECEGLQISPYWCSVPCFYAQQIVFSKTLERPQNIQDKTLQSPLASRRVSIEWSSSWLRHSLIIGRLYILRIIMLLVIQSASICLQVNIKSSPNIWYLFCAHFHFLEKARHLLM